MINLARNGDGEIRVVEDQFGQPTYAKDVAIQIIDSILMEIPFGTYHSTSGGIATWYDFATKIFELVGADSNRIIPTDSISYQQIATRPSFSVLSHDKWLETKVSPIRDWKISLEYAIPKIISRLNIDQSTELAY